MVTCCPDRLYVAAGQRLPIMASTSRFSVNTSITTAVAPRSCALAVSVRTNAEPTPLPCLASATTTPMSVLRLPVAVVASTAMACPMTVASSVATSTSVSRPPPARMRSIAPLAGEQPVKNLR